MLKFLFYFWIKITNALKDFLENVVLDVNFTVLSTVSVYLASIWEINGKLNILNLTRIYFFLIKKIKSDFSK